LKRIIEDKMKKIKYVVGTIIFTVCFICVGWFFDYILTGYDNLYSKLMMLQLHELEENVDVVFVGSSHTYMSLIPSITDELFESYTFNAGTSSQRMDGSVMMIKEVADDNDLKKVYLELFYQIAVLDISYEDRTEISSTYVVADYISSPLRRVNYFLHASSKEYWINSFIRPRRRWTYFFDEEYVRTLVKNKLSGNYNKYVNTQDDTATEYYVDRGFVANLNVMSFEEPENNTVFVGEIPVESLNGSDWEKSLNEAIDYCKDNNIEITLFVTPMPECVIAGLDNYQEYHDYIQQIALDNNIELYDFNFCKKEYFDASDGNLFKDWEHTNLNGAEKFSVIFGNVVTGKIKKEDALFDTLDEKLAADNFTDY
jgi:hypothetical protein